MKSWSIPESTELEQLLEWCIGRKGVDRLLVVARLDQESAERELLCPAVLDSIENLFQDRILERRYTSAWPGTELSGHHALVLVVNFDIDLVEPMSRCGRLLSDWTQWNSPPLPEDICLFKHGDSLPVLVSVTHEKRGWIISKGDVDIEGATESEFSVDELLIPGGSGNFIG